MQKKINIFLGFGEKVYSRYGLKVQSRLYEEFEMAG